MPSSCDFPLGPGGTVGEVWALGVWLGALGRKVLETQEVEARDLSVSVRLALPFLGSAGSYTPQAPAGGLGVSPET